MMWHPQLQSTVAKSRFLFVNIIDIKLDDVGFFTYSLFLFQYTSFFFLQCCDVLYQFK
jgi:hypothetical protein